MSDTAFTLHSRLSEDCFILDEEPDALVLLLNNQLFPWFIVVPKVLEQEIYQLDPVMQQSLLVLVNRVSAFVQAYYLVDKLNVAAIGNLVPQLHVHVVGRNRGDAAWPGVVWGIDQSRSYESSEVEAIRAAYLSFTS